MTTYSTIADGQIDQDSPVTQPLLTALRDNPIAISEGSSGAPVNQAAWHPFDMVTVGDGKDGELWSFATDGAVATVTTPDFEDGYEYSVWFDTINPSGAANSLDMNPYLGVSDAYSGAITISSLSINNNPRFVFSYPRTLFPRLEYSDYRGTGSTYYQSNTVSEFCVRLRFNLTTTDFNAGAIYMYRRREFISG